MKIVYNKLVRDNIPLVIEAAGKKANYRIISSNEEFKKLLLNKLDEEISELKEAVELKDEKGIIEELADVYDVLEAFTLAFNIEGEVYRARLNKHIEKGKFKHKIFLESVVE